MTFLRLGHKKKGYRLLDIWILRNRQQMLQFHHANTSAYFLGHDAWGISGFCGTPSGFRGADH